MNKTDDYLEPLKYYESYLKDAHNDNVTNFFDELTKESQVDIASNATTVNNINRTQNILDKLNKKLSGTKVLIVFMIIFAVLFIIGGIILLILGINDSNALLIALGPVAMVLGIAIFIIYFKIMRNRKKILEEDIAKNNKILEKEKGEAYAQMAPLNSLFKDEIPIQLMEKTAPIFDFDEYLKDLNEERLINQFGDKLDTSPTHSTICMQSGNINNNPFLLRQVYTMTMGTETYVGTLVITYTKTVSDGNGGTRTVTVTQTLTASVTKPKPFYGVSTSLYYYNDGADKLTMSRSPAGLVGKSDKEIEKIAYKKDKQESAKAEKALKQGKNYTKFANSKFEAYLNCNSRDNEMEYRLLFTPLAQTNLMYYFSKYDDIYFAKNKMVNVVSSSHDTGKDYSGDISNYYHYDYETIKKNFITYNNDFFKGLYLDFAPLMSIPLYHQHRSENYIAPRNRKESISYYEAEVLINKFDPKNFVPVGCDTPVILKPSIGSNMINITSFGYKAIPQVDYVPVMGGDGRSHLVPVHYYEYEPISGSYAISYRMGEEASLDKDNDVIKYRQFKAKLL